MKGHTVDLGLKPTEGSSRELLLRGPVMESVRNPDICEVFQDGALHSQLVEIRVKEGDDSLRKGRGTIKVHDDRDALKDGSGNRRADRLLLMEQELQRVSKAA